MKLVMYGEPYQERPGVIVDERYIFDLELEELSSPHSLEEILEYDQIEQIREIASGKLPEKALIPLDNVRLGPPLSGMGKLLAVGTNYRAHAEEMGIKPAPNPLLFAKAQSSIAGAYDDLILPPAKWSEEIDYEVELAVVIGHFCHEVSVSDALAYVAGYTVLNDVTARDIQRTEGQWFRAKSYDGFCPIGPYLVTKDEIEDPQALKLSTKVNGEVRQNSSTGDMIFSVAEIVSFASHSMTLLPGDVIATGTPSGIGGGMKPPRFLKPGDTLEIEVEKVGKHKCKVVEYK